VILGTTSNSYYACMQIDIFVQVLQADGGEHANASLRLSSFKISKLEFTAIITTTFTTTITKHFSFKQVAVG
jgi:ribonuclease PH